MPPEYGERHGWRLARTRAFDAALGPLEVEVRRLAAERPGDWTRHPKAKLLRRITDLILDEIPRDPAANTYALGNTLGPAHRHWRRAKFMQRFRLLFRFDSASRIIVYAWINDEGTLRKAGSRNDPYAVFLRRLNTGDPPSAWDELLQETRLGDDPPG